MVPERGATFSQNTQLIPGTHTVAWDQDPYYNLYNLDTQTTTQIEAPVAGFDEHELFYDAGGNAWMLSRPPVKGYNLSSIGFPNIHAIADCVVEEVNPQGQLIWEWRASQHVSPDETIPWLVGKIKTEGVETVDAYHCNSIDVDPLNQNDVLVSMRSVGVFLIDKTTGDIVWKLGGTSVPRRAENRCLPLPAIRNRRFPDNMMQGSSRMETSPCMTITPMCVGVRGIEYAIDTSNDTATMVWEYANPSGHHGTSMGSVRMYDSNTEPYDESGSSYLGDSITVVDWGFGAPKAGFTVINPDNQVLMNLAYPAGFVGYRAEMVPLSALDLKELHDSAGTQVPS